MAFRWALIVALLGALLGALLAVGPTLNDPDPEGYVSYARGLAETGSLQWHRRLPGYPALILAVDAIGPYSIPWDMFWFHVGLTVLFALATTLLLWRWTGFWTAALYLAVLSINSHFARNAAVMFADLPHTVLLYLAAIPAILFLVGRSRRRWLWLSLYAVIAWAAFVIHPSGDLRLQLFIWAGVFVALLRAALVRRYRPELAGALVSLIALSGATLLASQITQRFFQLPHMTEAIEPRLGSASSANYLRAFLGYRMLLCLPPPREPAPIDLLIEERKAQLSRRQGFPADAVVPPGYAPEFADLLSEGMIPMNLWLARLRDHPFDIIGCAASEMRAKWHYLLRNLTPFTNFEQDKTWITPDYPPQSDARVHRIFWRTGLTIFRVVAPTDADSRIRPAVTYEVIRTIIVVALILIGVMLIDWRWPYLGSVFLIGTVGWFVALSVAVPVETRYFMPNMPIVYMAQAMAAVWIARTVLLLPYWAVLGLAGSARAADDLGRKLASRYPGLVRSR